MTLDCIGRCFICLTIISARLAVAQTTAPAASLQIVGDGKTLNTTAIQTAIDALSAKGGGQLQFPAGRYVTGTIQLKDNVTLNLADNAVLLGSLNAADYRNVDPFIAGDGVALGYALITAVDAKHVGITGKGTIDGQGKAVAAAQKPYNVRPFLLRWVRCQDVGMQGVTLRNPGAWTNQFYQCHNVTARGLTIRSAEARLVNNDGIDIDSCQNVQVSDCDIDSGDDAICIKATSPIASTDIDVSHCKLRTRCNAIKLGTESLGDFARISVSECQARDIGMAGIAMYCVDGAHMQQVHVSQITMNAVSTPISLRLGARLKTFHAGDASKPTGTLSDVTISDIHATGAKNIGMLINGIPDHPIERITLSHIAIDVAGGGNAEDASIELPERESAYPEMNMFGKVLPAFGMYIRHARSLTLSDVTVQPAKPDGRPEQSLIDVDPIKTK